MLLDKGAGAARVPCFGCSCLVRHHFAKFLTRATFCGAAVLLLTWLLLGARYERGHFAGAAVCIGGLATLVLADSSGSQSDYQHAWLGDALVIVGAR